MSILDLLLPTTFGKRVAEDEAELLENYFVETDHWRKLYSDDIDIIYGPKGSGKSALYSLLVGRSDDLFDRMVLITAAENPRGTPAFRSLVADPPASEQEFIALWKLYVACLISAKLDEYSVTVNEANELRDHLHNSGLIPTPNNLNGLIKNTFDYIKRLFHPDALECSLTLDPINQMPAVISARVIVGEPNSKQKAEGIVSIDHLLQLGNDALEQTGYKLWILLDRLDVAFTDSPELEQNALRALFHVYLDFMSLRSFRMKIFLRTDIWQRITSSGFREASHITRDLTIAWNKSSLLNLIVRRAVQNKEILSHFRICADDVLSSTVNQQSFFYHLFPDQVEIGQRKSSSLDWMLSRTCDSTKMSAPREIIHLLNALRDAQVRRLELGHTEPDSARLFSRAVFKEALPEVSQVRLEHTLYAEYPDKRKYIEMLRGLKAHHSIKSLAKIWSFNFDDALSYARELCTIGFFELRGDNTEPTYWIPFLYRDALNLTQGFAN